MDQPSPDTVSTHTRSELGAAILVFKNKATRHLRESWEQEEPQVHFKLLADGLKALVPELLAVGDVAARDVKSRSLDFRGWFITFEWIDHAKFFMLLWRDILFQEQRAWLKVTAGEVTMPHFEQLRHTAKQSITDAAAILFSDLESAANHPFNNIKQLEKWGLQDVPWPIYKKQIEQLPEQADSLIRQSEVLWETSAIFSKIESHITETYDFWLTQITDLKIGLQNILLKIEKTETVDSDVLIKDLEQVDDDWEKPNSREIFQAHLDDYISRLPQKEKIFAGANGGVLLYRDIAFRSEVRAWLESELISEVYELFTIQEGITNKIHLNIVSIRNLLLLDDEGQQQTDQEAIAQVLTNFLKSLNRSEERTRQLKSTAQQQLDKEFALSNVYKSDFLARPIQYTINQYRDSARWLEIKNWIEKQGARVSQLQRNVLAEEALSISERIVRVVNSRCPQPENSHYTNMFLTKGWVGDSFVVGRHQELARVSNMVDNWKLGFRGAIMLTGKRFSGKSLFGELIDQRFFYNRAIKLIPNTRCVLPGKKKRHLDISCDLDEALQFIGRFSRDQQAMVFIDDLELWQNDKTELAENVNKLLRFIDKYSNRLFFVVSMSSWMKAHLSRAFDIDKVFQSEINMGSMSQANIKEAILVRHSATHTVLYNEEGVEMPGSELSRIINRISQLSEGNIGESLQRWAYTVEKDDEEKIRLPQTSLYSIPPFLSTQSAMLLRSIMMDKISSEKQLRKLFGPDYNKNYEVVLKRMLHLGIVEKENGRLNVNRYLSNEIAKLLSQRIGFQYAPQSGSKKQIRI